MLFTSSNKLICQEYDAYQQFMCPVSLMPAKCFFFMFLLFYVFTFPHQNLNYIFVLFCLQAVFSWCCWGYVCIMRWRIWEWEELIAVRHGHQRLEEIRDRGQVMESKQTQGKRLKSKAQSKSTKGKDSDHSSNSCPPSVLKCTYWSEKSLFFFRFHTPKLPSSSVVYLWPYTRV